MEANETGSNVRNTKISTYGNILLPVQAVATVKELYGLRSNIINSAGEMGDIA